MKRQRRLDPLLVLLGCAFAGCLTVNLLVLAGWLR